MATFERDAATQRVIEELKRLYKTKILPLEQMYRFDLFNSPNLTGMVYPLTRLLLSQRNQQID